VKQRRGIFYRRLEDVNLPARQRAIYSQKWGRKTKEKGQEAAGSAQHGIHFSPMHAPTRLLATKLLPFAAPLLGAGDETSGDDKASVVTLIVGHATSHAPSWRPRSPPPRGQGLDRVRRMKKCMGGTTGQDFLHRRPPNGIWGPLGGRVEML
jgi:hypothetical protein